MINVDGAFDETKDREALVLLSETAFIPHVLDAPSLKLRLLGMVSYWPKNWM
jgi:hypothetical protein